MENSRKDQGLFNGVRPDLQSPAEKIAEKTVC